MGMILASHRARRPGDDIGWGRRCPEFLAILIGEKVYVPENWNF